jgi:hypothetical protein
MCGNRGATGSFAFKGPRRLLWQCSAIAQDEVTVAPCPGAKTSVARWPRENFVRLAEVLLVAFPRLRLLVLGGAADAEVAQDLRNSLGSRVVNAAGPLSVRQSAEAMRPVRGERFRTDAPRRAYGRPLRSCLLCQGARRECGTRKTKAASSSARHCHAPGVCVTNAMIEGHRASPA